MLSEGRVVGAKYSPNQNSVMLYFQRRLTPERIGEYKSISELNKNRNMNFQLSRNRRLLTTTMIISDEAAVALRKSLTNIAPSINLNRTAQNVAYILHGD